MIAFALSWLLVAKDETLPQVSKTERFDLSSSGTVRLEHSTGELTIQGWDEPQVEITTIESAKPSSGPIDRDTATRRLEQVRITTEHRGMDLVIATALPGRRVPLLSRNTDDVNIDYHLKVPRKAHLVIDHGEGEVHLEDLSGDIEAAVHRGLIVLRLPQDAQYDIDAKTRLGNVYSDFPGSIRNRFWRVGHELVQPVSATSPKLHFRVGYGDILILKMTEKPASTAAFH